MTAPGPEGVGVLRAIELFGCSGGMAEGFRRAGVDFLFCFDWSDDARASYGTNLGHRPIGIDVRDLVRMVQGGWRLDGLDLLVADPPCTPWSRAGKRQGLDDERDMLRETVALIRALRPRMYLIGNVPGLQDASSWGVVQAVIGGLSADGYCTADYVQLDAADYGVPQHRVRPFWFGHLGGPCIRWPERTHTDPATLHTETLPGVLPLRPWVTCRDALGHLPPDELGASIRVSHRCKDRRPSGLDEPAKTLTQNVCGDGALLTNEKHPINQPDAPSFTVTTKGDGRGAQGACVMAWPWERPATTVLADDRLAPPGHHGGSLLTATEESPNAVRLSEKAAAILQGFPDGWLFAGDTKKARWSQLGMAMPPPLAEAVARSIVDLATAAQRPGGG